VHARPAVGLEHLFGLRQPRLGLLPRSGSAIDLDSRSAPARFNRALAYEKKREVPEALEDYLAFGAVPRVTAYVAFGAVTVAFLIQIVGGLSTAPSWVMDLSPFSHLAPVPATPVDVTATLVALAIAVASAGLGLVAFNRRDLASD
jgi:hypothetical protein